jgi:hypothetical protein
MRLRQAGVARADVCDRYLAPSARASRTAVAVRRVILVAGATAYQPADGTNVADYLMAAGPLAADVRVLYGL